MRCTYMARRDVARARMLALLGGRQRSTRLPCSLRARAPRRAFARCEWPGLATGRPWTGSMQRFAGLSAARAHVPAHAIGQRSKAAALAHAPPRLFSWGLAGLGLPWVDPGPVRRKKATPPRAHPRARDPRAHWHRKGAPASCGAVGGGEGEEEVAAAQAGQVLPAWQHSTAARVSWHSGHM